MSHATSASTPLGGIVSAIGRKTATHTAGSCTAIPLVVAALMAGAAPAHALTLDCTSPAVSLNVIVDPSAGRCAVDGAEASLRKPYDPVVCHVSTPQLQILTIARDGSFTWEDTASARVERGTCAGL